MGEFVDLGNGSEVPQRCVTECPLFFGLDEEQRLRILGGCAMIMDLRCTTGPGYRLTEGGRKTKTLLCHLPEMQKELVGTGARVTRRSLAPPPL